MNLGPTAPSETSTIRRLAERLARVCESSLNILWSARGRPLAQALWGTSGALIGWACVEPFFREGGGEAAAGMVSALFFPVVVGAISSALVVGSRRRWWDASQTATTAAAAFGVSLAVGLLLVAPTNILFQWMCAGQDLLSDQRAGARTIGLQAARAASWSLLGAAVGLGQGAVSRNLPGSLTTGLGAMLGGLIGGWVFDPLNSFVTQMSPYSAWISRAVAFGLMGAMAGFTQAVALNPGVKCGLIVLSGENAGTRVSLGTGPVLIGLRSRVDPTSAEDGDWGPAVIQKVGFHFEIEAHDPGSAVEVNRRPVWRARLQDGDRVSAGSESFLFFEE